MEGIAKIFRFDPETDTAPHYQNYSFEYRSGMTVLDVLNEIYEKQDQTLSYCYCCRNRHCGLCGVMVNGAPTLSCKRHAEPELVIEPLKGFPVLKDLYVDREAYEKNRPELRLMLERNHPPETEPEQIDMDSFEKFKLASRCIECYCCVSACPVYARSPHSFLGPSGFVLEARHFFDPRDELDRSLILKSEGIDKCIQCGLCSKACMLDVNPCGVIGLLKERIK